MKHLIVALLHWSILFGMMLLVIIYLDLLLSIIVEIGLALVGKGETILLITCAV
jgi:hypothetical protein